MSSQVLKPVPPATASEPPKDVSEQITVQGALRCPYCHDSCEPSGSVVCRDCLARHHAPCWEEQGACSACGSTHRLVAEGLEERSRRELMDMLRRGKSAEVQAYYRRRGASEDEALAKAAELAFAALRMLGPARRRSAAPGWIFGLQSLGLGLTALIAAEAAGPALVGGVAVLLTTLIVSFVTRVLLGPPAAGPLRQLGLCLIAVLGAPMLIAAFDIAPGEGHPALFLLAVALAMTSAVWALPTIFGKLLSKLGLHSDDR